MFFGLDIPIWGYFFAGIFAQVLGKKGLLVMFPQLAPFLAVAGPV